MNSISQSSGNSQLPKTLGMQSFGPSSNEPFARSADLVGERMSQNKRREMDADAMTMANRRADSSACSILVGKDFADLLKWSELIQTDSQGQAMIPLVFSRQSNDLENTRLSSEKGIKIGEGSTDPFLAYHRRCRR